MLCTLKTTIPCQFGSFVTSLLTYISINSHPFVVGIVSQCDDLLVFDDHIHQDTIGTQPKASILDHSTTSRLILKTMMSGVPQHLRKKYTFKHLPSLDLLPHHDPMYPQRHLNPTSPLPTSKRGLRGMQVPIPSSRMKGTTTPSFVTSRQLPRHKD